MGTEQNQNPFEYVEADELREAMPGVADTNREEKKTAAESPISSLPVPRSLSQYATPVIITLVLMLLIGGVGFAASRFIISMKTEPTRVEPAQHVFSVQVYDSEQVNLQELIQGFGTVRAMQQVTLSAQVAGEVVETLRPLKIGQSISADIYLKDSEGVSYRKPGEMIARIDPQTYQEKVDQANNLIQEDHAELSRINQEEINLKRRHLIQKKNVTIFQKEYNRVNNLLKQNVVNESDLTTVELDLSQYEDALVQVETELAIIPQRKKQILARINSHKSDLKIAKLEFNRTTLTSPLTGQFSEVHVQRGQYVKVGDPIVTVINFERVEIPVGIPLEDYLKLIPQINAQNYPRVAIRSNSASAGTWQGIITRAAPLADAQTRTVEVFVVVDNKQSPTPLLPGTFVTLSIEGPVYQNVIPIPREAVYQGSVFVVNKDKAELKPVVVKTNIQTFSLIESGLEPGDSVILTNLDTLKSGDLVKISNEEISTLNSEIKQLPFPFLQRLE